VKSRHHLSKNTVSETYHCNKCGRSTPHRVDDGRKGPCLVCHPDSAVKQKAVIPTPEGVEEIDPLCTCLLGSALLFAVEDQRRADDRAACTKIRRC
jgi:hypothetical protein